MGIGEAKVVSLSLRIMRSNILLLRLKWVWAAFCLFCISHNNLLLALLTFYSMLQCVAASARGSGVDTSQLRTSLGGVILHDGWWSVHGRHKHPERPNLGFNHGVCLSCRCSRFFSGTGKYQESVIKDIFKCLCSFQTFVFSVLLFIYAFITI